MKLLVAKRVLKNYAKGLRCPKERLAHAVRRLNRHRRRQGASSAADHLWKYILDEFGEPLLLISPVRRGEMFRDVLLFVWGHFFEHSRRRLLARDQFDNVIVSTVFLGLDHYHLHDGPPILWETALLYPGKRWDVIGRYRSRVGAIEGHVRAVVRVLSMPSESAEAS